jgi:hypothetical protein
VPWITKAGALIWSILGETGVPGSSRIAWLVMLAWMSRLRSTMRPASSRTRGWSNTPRDSRRSPSTM